MVSRRPDGANPRHKATHARPPAPRGGTARQGSAPIAPGRPTPRSGRPGWGADDGQAGWSPDGGYAGWDGDGGRAGWNSGAGQAGWSADGGYAGWRADAGRPGQGATAGQAGWDPGADHPSWPAADASPGWAERGADHPSWPANDASGWAQGGADYPSWPANDVSASWVPGTDHPSWPANDASGWAQGGADYPSWSANDPGASWVPGTDHPSWPAGAAGPDWPQPGTDYSSRPANDPRAYQPGGSPNAGDESWAFPSSDHPSWPAGAAGADWPRPGTDYSSRPANDPGVGRAPAHSAPVHGTAAWPQEPPGGLHHDQRGQTAAPHSVARSAPGRATTTEYQIRPPMGAHAKGQRWSAKLARATDTTTQTYYELAFGDGRLQVMLTEPPTADGWARGQARQMQALPPGGQQAGVVAWETDNLQDSDSVRVAARILSDADYQAAEIRRAAADQATALREAAEAEAAQVRQQTAAETAPIREGAEREAAQIREQAAARAAAVRETAEHEAAAIRTAAQQEADALRSAIQTMSADLDRMAAYITENFTGPIERITEDVRPANVRPIDDYPQPADAYAGPAALPETPDLTAWAPAPVAAPDADPAALAPAVDPYEAPYDDEALGTFEEAPGGAWAPSRATQVITPDRPAVKPVRKTEKQARPRQYRTMRVFAGTIAGLVVLAVGTGAYQLGTRGYTFFVFRSAGTGATDNNAVFPGIIPTPKPSGAHHQPPKGHPQPSKGRHARGAHHHHPGGTHHHVKGH